MNTFGWSIAVCVLLVSVLTFYSVDVGISRFLRNFAIIYETFDINY